MTKQEKIDAIDKKSELVEVVGLGKNGLEKDVKYMVGHEAAKQLRDRKLVK